MTDAATSQSRNRASRLSALGAVLAGGAAALMLSTAALWLIRDQLHIRCSMGAPGSEGANTWACSDGIGYLTAAAGLGGMWFLVTMVGALVAVLVRNAQVARVFLVLLATTATVWILVWTWGSSATLVSDEWAPMTGEGYWAVNVGPAAIASAIGIALAVIGLFVSGRSAILLTACATVALIVATVLQIGLAVNTLTAAGLLAAAAVRVTRSEAHRGRPGHIAARE